MKKIIVILSAFLSPFRSGAEACAEEVPLLLSDRYDFVIITCRGRRSLPKHDMLQGKIPVVRVGLGFGLGLDKWLYPFLASWEVRKHKPEIVHAILETFAGLSLLLCRFTVPKAKRILTCQTTNRSFMKRSIVRSADTVIAISNYLADIVKKLGRGDITVIPNGIHVQRFEETRQKYQKVPGRILFVGRLEKMKGVDTLLRAFAQLDGDVHLRIVGDGSQRNALQALARDLGISDRVTFVGRVAPDHIYKEYAEAQVFCGLSKSEGLGNVFLEAQAGGCFPIHTDVGGIADLMDNGSVGWGINANEDVVSEAKKALNVVLKDTTLLSKTDKCIKNAKKFDWREIADRYARLYS